MFGLGVQELVIILVIVVVLFGGSKLPEIGSGIGRGIKNFKDSLKGEDKPRAIDDRKEEALQDAPSQKAADDRREG